MSKIDKNLVEEGINIAIAAINNRGLITKIRIKEIPKDDEIGADGFVELAMFDGNIRYGNEVRDFEFFVAVTQDTFHWKSKDWAWLTANSFLSHAACTFEGDEEKIKYLHNSREDIVDELLKQ